MLKFICIPLYYNDALKGSEKQNAFYITYYESFQFTVGFADKTPNINNFLRYIN